MKPYLLAMMLLSVLLLSACGQNTKGVTIKEEKNTQEETAEDTATEEETEEEVQEEEQPESKLGSRSNPVPFQSTATIDDELYDDNYDSYPIKFDLTVTEVVRGEEAYQKLIAMNQFNEAAPEGYEWVLAKAKVKFVESATQDYAFRIDRIMNFEMVSETGDIYSGDIIGSVEPDFSFEMYVGNEKEGYISGLVKTEEKAQLRYEELIGGQVFFNLQ